jgi:uncharacterized membrane protein YdbT with pleckstrin-like domain
MPITALFRTILIAGLMTSVISAVAGITLTDTLPAFLQEYLIQVENEEMYDSTASILLMTTISILFIISIIGLWKFKNWARIIYIVIIILFIPLYPAMDSVIMNPWEAMFNDITLILEGVLIAMMFFSPIHEEFKTNS